MFFVLNLLFVALSVIIRHFSLWSSSALLDFKSHKQSRGQRQTEASLWVPQHGSTSADRAGFTISMITTKVSFRSTDLHSFDISRLDTSPTIGWMVMNQNRRRIGRTESSRQRSSLETLRTARSIHKCRSGGFFNAHDRFWAEQCEPLHLVLRQCDDTGNLDGNANDHVVGSATVTTTIVVPLDDGTPQVITTVVADPLCEIDAGKRLAFCISRALAKCSWRSIYPGKGMSLGKEPSTRSMQPFGNPAKEATRSPGNPRFAVFNHGVCNLPFSAWQERNPRHKRKGTEAQKRPTNVPPAHAAYRQPLSIGWLMERRRGDPVREHGSRFSFEAGIVAARAVWQAIAP
ncbi:hypothetical protein V8F20_005415 [Naviculisporaceae sp. PSN 640]